MEKKTQTLAELKGKEVALRDKIENGRATLRDVLDLNKIRRAVHEIESVLLWSILALTIFIAVGCQTFKGAMSDTAWLLQKGADNIQPKQEK